MSDTATATSTADTGSQATNGGGTGTGTAVAPRAALLGGGAESGGSQASLKPAAGNAGSKAGEIVMEQDSNGDWRHSFASGLDEPMQQEWGTLAKRYGTQSEMAKAHINAVRTLRNSIQVPGEKAAPEELDTIFNKLGRPEKAEDYKLNFPKDAPWGDEDRGRFNDLLPLFHKARATQAQLDQFIVNQAELDKVAADASETKTNQIAAQHRKTNEAKFRGENMREVAAIIEAGAKDMFGGEVETARGLCLADGTFVLDHPLFIDAMHARGRGAVEDDHDPSAFSNTFRGDVDAKIKQLRDKAAEDGYTPSHPRYPHGEIDALMAKKRRPRNEYEGNRA